MLKKIQCSLLVLTLPLLLSCNSEGNQEGTESETAYTEYRDLVTQFEEDTLTEIERRAMADPNFDSATWATLTAEEEQQYEQKRQAVEQNLEKYPSERQQEIWKLNQRYNQEMENREMVYMEASYRYKLRQELLGLEIKKDDLSDIAPTEMANTY